MYILFHVEHVKFQEKNCLLEKFVPFKTNEVVKMEIFEILTILLGTIPLKLICEATEGTSKIPKQPTYFECFLLAYFLWVTFDTFN